MDDPLTSEQPEEARRAEPARVPWRPIESLPIAVVALAVTALLTAAIPPDGAGFLVVALAFEAALLSGPLLWIRLRYPGAMPALRAIGPRPWKDLAIGFAAGLGLFAFTVIVVAPIVFGLLSLLSGEPVIPPEQPVLPEDPALVHLVLGGIVAIVAAPVGEEVFFRGFLHRALRPGLRFWPAALISGAAFAIFHGLVLLMPLFLVVGIGLAWIYERRGSLIASIAAHAAFNVVGYTFIIRNLER